MESLAADSLSLFSGCPRFHKIFFIFKGQVPQFGYCDEINMNQMVSLREAIKEEFLGREVRFSYMPVIIKAVSMALGEFPVLNATIDPDCTALTYRADHNIGVAMDTPEGLVVPNIKKVQVLSPKNFQIFFSKINNYIIIIYFQSKSIFEIAVDLNRLQELGSKGQLSPTDIAGGTFSLSNIGAVSTNNMVKGCQYYLLLLQIGGTYTRPMLLPPQVAIGAFGKIHVLPRFDPSGSVVPGHVMQASWSADHRVIDGATMARFSNRWKELLEDPLKMIIKLC